MCKRYIVIIYNCSLVLNITGVYCILSILVESSIIGETPRHGYWTGIQYIMPQVRERRDKPTKTHKNDKIPNFASYDFYTLQTTRTHWNVDVPIVIIIVGVYIIWRVHIQEPTTLQFSYVSLFSHSIFDHIFSIRHRHSRDGRLW